MTNDTLTALDGLRISLKQAATALGCSPNALRRLADAGTIPTINTGTKTEKHYRVAVRDLDEIREAVEKEARERPARGQQVNVRVASLEERVARIENELGLNRDEPEDVPVEDAAVPG